MVEFSVPNSNLETLKKFQVGSFKMVEFAVTPLHIQIFKKKTLKDTDVKVFLMAHDKKVAKVHEL